MLVYAIKQKGRYKMYIIPVKCILGSSGDNHCGRWVRLVTSSLIQEQAEKAAKK
jgi:hypothetical protein